MLPTRKFNVNKISNHISNMWLVFKFYKELLIQKQTKQKVTKHYERDKNDRAILEINWAISYLFISAPNIWPTIYLLSYLEVSPRDKKNYIYTKYLWIFTPNLDQVWTQVTLHTHMKKVWKSYYLHITSLYREQGRPLMELQNVLRQ